MTTINNNSKLLQGFFHVCNAVAETMGAQGKLSIMENQMGNPVVTKDGITTAKAIYFKHPEKNIGANLAKQVAAKTLATAGDSTTTSLVLARGLVQNSKMSQGWFRKPKYFYNKRVEEGMDEAYLDICYYLEVLSEEVTPSTIKQIAAISSNNNAEIGDLVSRAYEAVGKDGIVDVKENYKSYDSNLSISNGMKIKNGWQSPFLINNQKNAKWEGEDVVVIVYEGILEGDEKVQKALKDNMSSSIILVAERFSEDVLINLADMNQRGTLDITAVQAPDYDQKRKALLEDIADYTGAEVFLRDSDQELVVGKCSKVIVDESSCSFVQDEVSTKVLKKVENLYSMLENVVDTEFIQYRIQNLQGVSATIHVGGVSQAEVKEKFDRVEDSVHAVKSSYKEGWISGGGTALLHISKIMDKNLATKEHQFGYNIVKKAIKEPFVQIMVNSKRNPNKFFKKGHSNNYSYGYGYNAYTDTEVNLITDGVIDSKKSIRTALQNALSVTKLLLNTAIIITNKR